MGALAFRRGPVHSAHPPRVHGSLVAGIAASVPVVAGAAWASSATSVAREAAVNWQSWDFSGIPVEATGVRFAWDSNYDGIEFPATKTVVLTAEGPERARYWRTSTLDLFASDHWFEDLLWLSRVDDESDAIHDSTRAPTCGARGELARAAGSRSGRSSTIASQLPARRLRSTRDGSAPCSACQAAFCASAAH